MPANLTCAGCTVVVTASSFNGHTVITRVGRLEACAVTPGQGGAGSRLRPKMPPNILQRKDLYALLEISLSTPLRIVFLPTCTVADINLPRWHPTSGRPHGVRRTPCTLGLCRAVLVLDLGSGRKQTIREPAGDVNHDKLSLTFAPPAICRRGLPSCQTLTEHTCQNGELVREHQTGHPATD